MTAPVPPTLRGRVHDIDQLPTTAEFMDCWAVTVGRRYAGWTGTAWTVGDWDAPMQAHEYFGIDLDDIPEQETTL